MKEELQLTKSKNDMAKKHTVVLCMIPKSHTKFVINGGIGLGEYITTGTQILLQLSFCDNKHDQLSLLDDVIKKLGIEPEDFNKKRRNDKKAENLIEDKDEIYSFE